MTNKEVLEGKQLKHGALIASIIHWIFIAVIVFVCSCCTKVIPESDERVVVISERYTNPPAWATGTTWKPYAIKIVPLSPGTDWAAYEHQKPDTIISTCSIDKIDSAFKIEIRKFAKLP